MSRLEVKQSKNIAKDKINVASAVLGTIIIILLYILLIVVSNRYINVKAIDDVANSLDDAIVSYYSSYGRYPQTLDELQKSTRVYIDESRYTVSYNVLEDKKPIVLIEEIGSGISNNKSDDNSNQNEMGESYE